MSGPRRQCLAGPRRLGQAAEPKAAEPKEKTITITKSQFDKYVADAVAAEREKAAREKPATDEEVLNPLNWHKAIFNKAEYVVYTGPGQVMFHHWVEPAPAKPAAKGPASPAPKGN